MRPLGIPTMNDRAHQALHLLALDPVLETNADRNSYGFRQQRSCADAIGQCFQDTVQSAKYAVDSGGRHQELFRPNFTRLASGACPYGPSHSPKMAEIRVYGKTRPSRNDGWNSTRWNYLSQRSLTARWMDLSDS